MVSLRLFIFVVPFINSVLAHTKCDLDDHECTKTGASKVFPIFVEGIENLVETSDPLSVDVVHGILPTIKYEMNDAKLVGMKTCEVTKLKIFKEYATFHFHLECPHIEFNTKYDMLGYFYTMYVEGNGELKVICDDYVFLFNGHFNKTIGNDGKTYAYISKYFLDAMPRGHVSIHFDNLYGGDEEKSEKIHKFLNENWKVMDKALRAPPINALMDKFINNLNNFLKTTSIEKIFPLLT